MEATGDSKEEGKAERSGLGEGPERSIGQRAGWEEPKRPIVSGRGAGGMQTRWKSQELSEARSQSAAKGCGFI